MNRLDRLETLIDQTITDCAQATDPDTKRKFHAVIDDLMAQRRDEIVHLYDNGELHKTPF